MTMSYLEIDTIEIKSFLRKAKKFIPRPPSVFGYLNGVHVQTTPEGVRFTASTGNTLLTHTFNCKVIGGIDVIIPISLINVYLKHDKSDTTNIGISNDILKNEIVTINSCSGQAIDFKYPAFNRVLDQDTYNTISTDLPELLRICKTTNSTEMWFEYNNDIKNTLKIMIFNEGEETSICLQAKFSSEYCFCVPLDIKTFINVFSSFGVKALNKIQFSINDDYRFIKLLYDGSTALMMLNRGYH